MADSALIEVFGPLDDVERAVLALPATVNERRNRVGTLLLDLEGEPALTVLVGDSNPTLVTVEGRGVDVMPAAGALYRGLATRVKYPMQLIDGSTDEAEAAAVFASLAGGAS